MSPAAPPCSAAAKASGVGWEVEAWEDKVEPPCTTGNEGHAWVWGTGKDILRFLEFSQSLTLANVVDPGCSVSRIVFSQVTPGQMKFRKRQRQSNVEIICFLPACSSDVGSRYNYGRKQWPSVISKDPGGQVGARLCQMLTSFSKFKHLASLLTTWVLLNCLAWKETRVSVVLTFSAALSVASPPMATATVAKMAVPRSIFLLFWGSGRRIVRKSEWRK